MSFLAPITALIAAAIAIPALVALYFLKLRRRQVTVASTLLWKKAVQDMQVNAPFQKLRRNLLLLLQLLLLAALLLAMGRPTTRTVAAPGQRVVIVIDRSASMNATDADASGTTRLEQAKRAAIELIGSLGTGDRTAASGAMVVTFAQQARVLQPFTGDPALLRDAIRRIVPTDQRSRLGTALRLIEPFALRARSAAESGEAPGLVVYVFSDGRVHHEASTPLALPGAELVYRPMGGGGGEAGNLGFVSFSARRDFERPRVVQVFARLANAGPAPVTAHVTLRLDERVRGVQAVRVPAAGDDGPGVTSLQFDFVLVGAAMVQVSHDHADALSADDAARLMLAPARRLRVLLVTAGNAFLERVIESVGVRDLVLMTPQKYENQDPKRLRRAEWDPAAAGATAGAAQGFDVIVFDGYAPKRVPLVNSLSFGAAPPIEGLDIVREEDRGDSGDEADEGGASGGGAQVILDWDRDHPLLRYVALDDVILSDPGRLVVPAGAAVLAVGQHGPIMAEVRDRGLRHVVTSFDILRSNWPLYVSFPVFISNAMQTLGLGGLYDDAGLSFTTGQVAVAPAAGGVETVRYEGPVDFEAAVTHGRAVLPVFTRVGVYEAGGGVEPPYHRVPVNLLDAVESDLRPVQTLAVGTRTVEGKSQSQTVRREVWHWFAWAALGLLMVEWLVYTRRMHL